MANKKIQQYAEMVNLQVASEAFLRDATTSELVSSSVSEGNRNNSKEPNTIANLFKTGGLGNDPRYKLIAHQDLTLNTSLTIPGTNNKSGFSASVFLDTTTGQYTLSIRSTEFADSIRDLADTTADGVEIPDYGWSFAQINSLEAFWSALKSGTAANGLNATTIPSAADLGKFIAATKAGTKVNVTGYSLGANVAEAFTELHRGEVSQAYFFNGAGTGNPLGGGTFAAVWAQYKAVFDNPFSKYPATGITKLATEKATDALYTYRAHPDASYASLYDNPRHILALNAIKNLVQGAFSASSLIGSTLNAPRTADGQMVDLFAYNYSGDDILDTATARSGQRHGTSRPIWYEDQPATTWTNGDFSKYDFGLGHSIVLLQDSLNLMAAFEKIAPSVTEDLLATVFEAGSKNNYDSLEKTLDSLARLVGIAAPLGAVTRDNQYADISLRNAFYDRLNAVQDSAPFKALAGKLKLEAWHPAAADIAHKDFAALVSLIAGATFSLRAVDQVSKTAVEAALKTVHASAYSDWNADQQSIASGVSPLALNFTDKWIEDRAAMLMALSYRNESNQTGIIDPNPARGVKAGHYLDVGSNTELQVGLNVSTTQEFQFGGAAVDNLVGRSAEDHLYGGAGSDTLKGLAGADYLEGNTGDDTLDGGGGHDILVGGAGSDTYTLRASDSGIDTIIDSDGQGTIKLIAADGSETILGTGTIKRIDNGTGLTGSWQSEDKRFTYTTHAEAGGNSTLSISGNGVSAIVKNFKSGDLGITLPGSNTSTAATPPAGNRILGDLAPVDFDVANDGVQSRKDALGNVITDPMQAEPDRADVLYDSAANDEIIAGGGADTVEATRGGNNWIKAGGGRDVVRSGAGTLRGLGGNDALYAWGGNDTLAGGAGNDTLYGMEGNDTYLYGRGDGTDTIREVDGTAGNLDQVVFGADIASDEIWLRRTGNNLDVSVIGTADKLVVENWYSGTPYRVEQLRAGDGKVLQDSAVDLLVQAMASLSPPPMGQTTLGAPLQTSLAPLLAASWH